MGGLRSLGADLVPWDTWRARAARLGADSPMAPFALTLEAADPQFRRPAFDCRHTERVLAQRDSQRLTDIFNATHDLVGIGDRAGRFRRRCSRPRR